MMEIGVDCRFAPDGKVRVQRIKIEGRWQPVGQGRQWRDENGRHVLVMLPQNEVRELILRPETMTWEMVTVTGSHGPRLA